MPVSDTEKLLKTKGYLRQTFPSAGTVYQPKVSQVNVKISAEEISLVDYKEIHHIKSHSAEASTSNPKIKLEDP